MVRARWSVAAVLSIAAVAAAFPVHAQTPGDKAAAETLFEDARRLMGEKKYVEACAKFEASERLDPAPGTQLNLADCSEKAGKTASAWVQFLEAASLAKNAGDPKREKAARERAAAIEPKLVRLNVGVPSAVAALPGLEVLRDGTKLDRALWGTAVPVDPGTHTIEAVATGKRRWSGKVDATAPGKTASIDVPALQDAPPGPVAATSAIPVPATAAAPVTSAAAPPPADTKDDDSGLGGQRTFALVAGGVGVVGVVVGSVLGLGAKGKWNDAQSHCTNGKTGCDDQGASLSRDAKSEANLSTVFFVIGAVGLAGGAALWLTAPSGDNKTTTGSTIRVSPDLGATRAGLQLGGTF